MTDVECQQESIFISTLKAVRDPSDSEMGLSGCCIPFYPTLPYVSAQGFYVD